MKKILFASTALVATAGVAAAELTWSGSGRLGVVYNENAAGTNEAVLDHRFRLTVNGITETDGGVKFEGRIRWEATDGIAGGNINGAGATGGAGAAGFAVSTGGFRVDVGSVSDVFDSGDVVTWGGIDVGYTGFMNQNQNFDGFRLEDFGAGASTTQTIKARYAVSDFTVAASYSLDDTTPGAKNDSWQIGAGYNFGAHRIGAMYGDDKAAGSQWAVGADGSFGDFAYNVLIGDNDTNDAAGGDISIGVGGSYAVSAAGTVKAFISNGGASANDTSYGIGYSHSLGGGVTLGAGVGSNKNGFTVADAGVTFNF